MFIFSRLRPPRQEKHDIQVNLSIPDEVVLRYKAYSGLWKKA
jgi:hypothetical protein